MKAISAALLMALALAQPVRADPAMWEARDADSRIVLFGSVHMLPSGLDWRTPALDAAMNASEHVYFETDIGPRGLAAITLKMIVSAYQTANTPWLHLLTHVQVNQLARQAAELGIGLQAAEAMPPWLLAMQISEHQMRDATGAGSGADFYAGVEWTLQWELPPERKAFFETPGEQFDMIATGTIEEQVAQLVAVLDQTEGGAQLDELIEAWQDGDVEGLQKFLSPTDQLDEAMLEALLFQRNRNWMPTVEKLLADNRESLIVVGAGHLTGAGSVLDLLEQAGYTVSRIQ
ncbi:MAG: TraB/GumN family protein [Hyphomicrobiales bacterium]|nr:MAG: TraB/GumN family protein [Hyphomicrobiales bacterium]